MKPLEQQPLSIPKSKRKLQQEPPIADPASHREHLSLNGSHKRHKTVQLSSLSRDRMSKTAGPIRLHRSKFQPHSGARRLTIKNARQDVIPDLENYYCRIFLQIQAAISAILSGQRPQQSLERLYRDVEEVCRNGQAELLFSQLYEACEIHLRENTLAVISGAVRSNTSIGTLEATHSCWQDWANKSVSDHPLSMKLFGKDFAHL